MTMLVVAFYKKLFVGCNVFVFLQTFGKPSGTKQGLCWICQRSEEDAGLFRIISFVYSRLSECVGCAMGSVFLRRVTALMWDDSR